MPGYKLTVPLELLLRPISKAKAIWQSSTSKLAQGDRIN